MTINEILAAIGALIAFHGAIVLPLTFAVWRLGTKVEKHAMMIEREVLPSIEQMKSKLDDHARHLARIDLERARMGVVTT